MRIDRSKQLFLEAKQHLPGGVNSPVRSFRAVGGQPLFITRGLGSHVQDVDGNDYIDYVLSWGPLIVGHAHPRVVEALQRAVERGTSYGAPTELETELARLVKSAFPSVKLIRMVNSGTEATMSAIRVARGHTGRDKIVKFAGCYHGAHDALLVKAGSGALTLGVPDSPGVPAAIVANTLTVPFNDLEAVRRAFREFGEDIAAVILEPVVGNMGFVRPKDGFLAGLRQITREYGSVLIFDEVMTGFRISVGGAQGYYGVEPDLTTFGKVIGGGLPVGAYGGSQEIMERVAPAGPVYQAGTLSGNPLAMTAGIQTLKLLSAPGTYEWLAALTQRLVGGLREIIGELGEGWQVDGLGSMFGLFFTDRPVTDYESALTADTKKFGVYFQRMLEQGIYLAPSQFEAGFLSTVHSGQDIDRTLIAARVALKAAQAATA